MHWSVTHLPIHNFLYIYIFISVVYCFLLGDVLSALRWFLNGFVVVVVVALLAVPSPRSTNEYFCCKLFPVNFSLQPSALRLYVVIVLLRQSVRQLASQPASQPASQAVCYSVCVSVGNMLIS